MGLILLAVSVAARFARQTVASGARTIPLFDKYGVHATFFGGSRRVRGGLVPADPPVRRFGRTISE